MKNKLLLSLTRMLLSGAVVTGGSAAQEQSAAAALDAPHEVRLARAEQDVGGYGYRTGFSNERTAYPFLAYYQVFDKAYTEAQTMEAKQRTGAPDGAAPATLPVQQTFTPLTFASMGALSASMNVSPVSPANLNWTVAAIGLGVLDILTRDFKQERYAREAAAAEERRMAPIMTPSINFVKKVPGAIEKDDLYAEITAGEAFVSGLGLGCEPALLHGTASPAFVGAARRDQSYTRKYVCGYNLGETLTEKQAQNEVKDYSVVAFMEGVPIVRFSLGNLPEMDRMKSVLGRSIFDSNKDLGRVVYERVKDNLPAEWTAVFTAPNLKGDMAVFVARAGVVAEFPLPRK